MCLVNSTRPQAAEVLFQVDTQKKGISVGYLQELFAAGERHLEKLLVSTEAGFTQNSFLYLLEVRVQHCV